MNQADVVNFGDPPTSSQHYLDSIASNSTALLDELRAEVAHASGEGLDHQVVRFLGFRGSRDDETIELQTLPNPTLKFPTAFALRTTTVDAVTAALMYADKDLGQGIIGAFYVMNQVHPDIIARSAANLWAPIGKQMGTNEGDIVERRILFFDHDPERRSGISSNEYEHEQARAAAEHTYLALAAILGPELRSAIGFGNSGNGFHVPLALAVECSGQADRVVQAVLLAGQELFSTPSVKIDTSVGDRKRLCPAYGTMKRKGESTVDRPHRPTFFSGNAKPERLGLDDLKQLAWVLRDRLAEGKRRDDVAALLEPTPASRGSSGRSAPRTPSASPQAAAPHGTGIFDRVKAIPVRDVADKLGLVEGEQVTCPGCGEHSGVGFYENGMKCHHDRCCQKGKKGFRTNVDLAMEVYNLDVLPAAQKLAEAFGLETSAYSAHSAANEWDDPTPLIAARRVEQFPVDALPPVDGAVDEIRSH